MGVMIGNKARADLNLVPGNQKRTCTLGRMLIKTLLTTNGSGRERKPQPRSSSSPRGLVGLAPSSFPLLELLRRGVFGSHIFSVMAVGSLECKEGNLD